jgi:hypothetical protein
MEAVAALGVAAAAFQFFDAGAKALVLCKQIRDSEKGTTDANHEREHHVHVLKEICKELRPDVTLLAADRQIAKTRDECIKLGNELLKLLNSFKPSSRSRWLCLKAAYRAMRGDKKIRGLQARLAASQTDFHLAVSVGTLNGVEQLLGDHRKINDSLRITLEEIRAARVESARNHARTHEQVTELQDATSAANDTTHFQLDSIQRDQRVSQQATESNRTACHKNFAKLEAGISEQLINTEVAATRDALLDSLRYDGMFDRQQFIKPPLSDTFEWIFDDSPPREEPTHDRHDRLQGKFVRWLRSDDTLFWISGKPGSGKSSLMSLIHDDPRTKEALSDSTWDGGKRLHIFAFYFWRPGSALQKSIAGLLRSLLYQLIQRKPEVADLVVAARLALDWTMRSLLSALQDSLDAYQGDRIFLMVDGLDEFEGQYAELLDLILDFQGRFIKICLASRPETAILARLKSFPTLRLQDLNYEDISKFVWNEVQRHDVDLSTGIIHEIIDRAEGVFLWAVLVVNSMISGCRDNHDAAMLQSRLDETPIELDALFAQLLAGVDKRHRESLFLCLFHLNGNLWGESLFRGRVSLIAASLPICQDIYSTDEFLDACTRTSATLVAQWKGLIEIRSECESVNATEGEYCEGGSWGYDHRKREHTR